MYDSSKGFTIGIIISLLLVFLLGFSVKEYKPDVYKRKKYKLVKMKILPKEKPKKRLRSNATKVTDVAVQHRPKKEKPKEKKKIKKKLKKKLKKKIKKKLKKKIVAKNPINQKKEKPKEKKLVKKKSPPVFGVTMSSVSKTGSSGFKVKVGNTLMTDDKTGWENGKPKEIGNYQGTEKESSDGIKDGSDNTTSPPPLKITKKAIPKKVFRPKYSKLAEEEEIEGKIILRLTIDKKGNVIKAKIIKGLGYGLDKETLKAVKKFKFSPAILSNGKPVKTKITYTINFILEN